MPVTAAIIVPAYNEEKTIFPCIKALRRSFELSTHIYVVDNRSTDGTPRLAQACGATVLHADEQGKGYAVFRGVAEALETGADWIVLHDADGEYSATDVFYLLQKCQAHSDPITPMMGVGLRQVSLGQVLWRSVFANWMTKRLLAFSTGKKPPSDILTGARVFNRSAAIALFNPEQVILGGFELETGLTRRAMQKNIRIVEADVHYTPRSAGEKKISAWDMLPIAKTAINIG